MQVLQRIDYRFDYSECICARASSKERQRRLNKQEDVVDECVTHKTLIQATRPEFETCVWQVFFPGFQLRIVSYLHVVKDEKCHCCISR